MTRTTLALDDDILKKLKEAAARQGRTMQSLTNDLLRQALGPFERRRPLKLTLQGWEAEELPGVDLLDRDKLFDLMEQR
jgi:plasmid stability protein